MSRLQKGKIISSLIIPFRPFYMIAFLFIMPFSILQAADVQQQKDSLRRAIAHTHGEEKLNAYRLLAVTYFFESKDSLKMDTMLTIYSQMDKEAQKQNNIEIRGVIRNNILAAYKNQGNFDEVFQRAPAYLALLEKEQNWFYYYNVYRFLVDSYLKVYQFDRAIAEAQKMYDKAHTFNHKDGMALALYAMAQIAGRQDRWEEAVTMERQAIELMKGDPKNYPILANVYFDLCQSMLSLKRYKELEPDLKAFENINRLYEENVKKEIPTTRANLWECYARYYIAVNELDKAELYYNKIDSALETTVYKILVYHGRAKIYRLRKQFDKALEEVNRLLELEEQTQRPDAGDLILKADILAEMGNCKESVALANQSLELKDSLGKIEYARQLDGLRTQYEVSKHIAEKERNRNYFLFALGACVLLFILLAIWIYYSREVTRKNRTLVRQIKELQNEQEIRNRNLLQKTTFQLPDSSASELCPESRRDKLCLALRDLLLKDKIYRESTLSRDGLVERLGINRFDLEDAFLFCFGIPYSEQINLLRLNDAIIMLEGSDLSMSEISENAGFGTVRTFQVQFRKKYDMSPRDYRKLAKEKKTEQQPS